jgi:transcription antitermination factor NusG
MILDQEPELYPAHLFENFDANQDRRWWLVHTKPRQEKALARYLYSLEFHFYLPCKVYRRKAKSRILQSYLPMFAGYAFVCVTEEERARIYGGNHVIKASDVRDQERLWHDLRQVRKILDLGLPVTTEDRLLPGTRIRVRSGPLIGMTGTIVKESSQDKFVIEVDLIQRGIGVVVDLASLGKIDEETPNSPRNSSSRSGSNGNSRPSHMGGPV